MPVGGETARISFLGNTLFVSDDCPYGRELMFEHVDLYARRYGDVRFEVNRRAGAIRAYVRRTPTLCGGCARRIDCVTYAIATRSFCVRCAKLAVA